MAKPNEVKPFKVTPGAERSDANSTRGVARDGRSLETQFDAQPDWARGTEDRLCTKRSARGKSAGIS